jgi:hypothetical protein
MITRGKVMAAVLFAAALVFGALQLGGSHISTQPHVRLEPLATKALMDEKTKMWLQWNELGADGSPVRTFTKYTNGDLGTLDWRENHTQDHEVIVDTSDHVVMKAAYADDGVQVVEGFRLRSDGSTIWAAVPDVNRKVTTTTYWYDGRNVFLVQERHIGSPRIEENYFHRNGVKWMHYAGTAQRDRAPSVAEIWNDRGNMTFSHYTGLNGMSDDSGYHDDGTREWRQLWATRVATQGTEVEVRQYLLKVEQFDGHGQMAREFILSMDGNVLQRVVDHDSQGDRSELIIDNIGLVSSVVTTDREGNLVPQKEPLPRPGPHIELATFLRSNHVKDFDPHTVWQRLEDDPTARG